MRTRAEIERWTAGQDTAFDVIVAGGGPAGVAMRMPLNRLLLDGGHRGLVQL